MAASEREAAAERSGIPPIPRIGASARAAGGDFYYNSWRFLGANLLLGIGIIALLLGLVATPLALLAVPLLAVPAAGTMRMATFLVREGHTDFGDFTTVVRRPWRVLALGAVQSLVFVVLVVDANLGASLDSFVGSLLQVSALYGLAIGWVYAAVAWTVVLDPLRDADTLRARLRLALVVLVAHPIRVGAALLGAGLVLGLATIMVAPAVTFAVAVIWLFIARFVLPLADRIEGRATAEKDA